MSPLTAQPESVRKRLHSLYAPVAVELAQAEELLKQELRSEYPFVDDLTQHAFKLGGKRLRPALLLLTAKACGGVHEHHLKLAAVVEMIHTATLVHDDVLDEAALRRHLETVNSRWGNKASVLLGDFLFTHSFYLASTLPTTYACQIIGKATNVVCEGELRQIHTQGDFDLTESEYFSIIEAKTAELTACCCELGAHYAGATAEVTAALAGFGRNLGIAFQIADDLLDVTGDEDQAGKSLGTDLDQAKPTLPLIYLLSSFAPAERAEFVNKLRRADEHRRELVAPYLEATGALQYAQTKAVEFANQAKSDLDVLPPSPAKDVLAGITRFVVNRKS